MCDLITAIGMTIGAASGLANASAQVETANKNQELYREQAKAEHASQQRELIVEQNAAKKDGNQASRHRDLTISSMLAKGEGASGNTIGQRVGEQLQQGSTSIENARDRSRGAQANYAMASSNTTKLANNQIKTAAVSPMQSFMTVATGALSGTGTFK